MKMKFRKLFIFSMIILILIQAGCTVIETNTDTDTDTTSVSSNTEELSGNTSPGNNSLVWYMPGYRQEPDLNIVLGEVNKILSDKIGAVLDLHIFESDEDYVRTVNTALAAKYPVDIVLTSYGLVDYYENALAGNFTKLDSYLRKYPALKDNGYKNYIDNLMVKGYVYGIPAQKLTAHNWGFIFRKDLIQKYNMDLSEISSIESIEPYLEIIRINEPQVIPLAVAGMDSPFKILGWNYIVGESVPGALYPDNRDNYIINQFTAPESIEYYRMIRRWYINGYTLKDASDMRDINELLKSGRFFAAAQYLTPGKDAEISESTDIRWVQADITAPVMSNSDLMDAVLAIPAGSKNREKAFLLIELLHTDADFKNLLDHGIENIHYTKVSENIISQVNTENPGYYPRFSDKFGNFFLSFLTEKEDPLRHEQILEYNNKSTMFGNLGFEFDKSSVAPQISACSNVVSAYCNILFTGSGDVDSTVKQFERELIVAGVEDLITEMQNQYNAWRNSR